MKIDYMSDNHIDFYITEHNPQSAKFEKQLKSYIDSLKPNNHDVLIIAGDLGHYFPQDSAFLLKMKEYYDNIVIVPGNHDMYLVSGGQESKYQWDSWNRVLEMKYFCRDNGIHYLDGNIVNIKGINFGGCGMSWDGSYANQMVDECKAIGYKEEDCEYYSEGELVEHWKNTMNDCKRMFMDGKRNLRIPLAYGSYYTQTSYDPLKFFKSQYAKLQKIDKVDVMVSHYGPKIPDKLPEGYKTVMTSFYYFDGLKDIQRIKPKFWIYGHTHSVYNDMYESCNLLTNPIGYPGERHKPIIQTITIEDIE